MIDWKSKNKNKTILICPSFTAVLLLIQVVAVPFGYKFQIDVINQQLLDIINAVFVVLTILGIAKQQTIQRLVYQIEKGDK